MGFIMSSVVTRIKEDIDMSAAFLAQNWPSIDNDIFSLSLEVGRQDKYYPGGI